MPLGTLDRTPPPFFRQGPSAATQLVFFSALAIFLMVADTRLKLTPPLRSVLATALFPLQQVAAMPMQFLQQGGLYMGGIAAAQSAEKESRKSLAEQALKTARATELQQENERLRALLELRPALAVRSISAELLYEAADPFSRKVFVNRGSSQGVLAGAPVVNEAGVVGQVTRVYAFSSEVTLLVDKDAAVPVLNARTQQRGVAFGGGLGGTLDLRYTAANADVQVGDLLQTSGLDGIYPAGLAVATVRNVDRRGESGFARVVLTPAAAADALRFVLLVEPVGLQLPPRPAAAAEALGSRASRAQARAAVASAAAASAAASGGAAPLRTAPAAPAPAAPTSAPAAPSPSPAPTGAPPTTAPTPAASAPVAGGAP
jgi:rod shape-determining protein MreC